MPLLVALGCGSSSGSGDGGGGGGGDGGPDPDAATYVPGQDAGFPVTYPKACHDIYDPSEVQEFHVEISDAEWAKLEEDRMLRDQRIAAGQDPNPYHPITSFSWGTTVAPGQAHIRLKGNKTWYTGKMQFVISFNETNPDNRFLGLRKISLDASTMNPSMLRDRLAMSIMTDLGVPAPCVNHAKLFVNGELYGTYANIEKVDKEFLQRNFAEDEGNLYKGIQTGMELQTNEGTADTSDKTQLYAVSSIDEAAGIMQVDWVLKHWAGEAIMPAGDGWVAGRLNYYVYNEPGKGFMWIPWDMDGTFDWVPVDADPTMYNANGNGRRPLFSVILSGIGNDRWLDELENAVDNAFDPATLQSRIDEWADQIHDHVADDVNRGFSMTTHNNSVDELRQYVADREAFLRDWLACQRNPDGATDADADGNVWCRDCDEVSCTKPAPPPPPPSP